MATSQKHGATSSLPTTPERVLALGADPRIKILLTALGSESDLHIVGGTVRDALAGEVKAFDLDLACRFSPQDTAAKLEAAGVHTILTGLKHGTVTAVVNESNCEITTFRKPGPLMLERQVYGASIQEDLSARDFTINAIAYSLNNNCLVDTEAGVTDLKANLLRAVGSAEVRFREDPLRILRMIRFGPAAGRQLEPSTRAAAQTLAATLKDVSVERIKSEISKILVCKGVVEAFREIAALNLLEFTIPELIPAVGMEQNEFHRFDVYEHTLQVIKNCPPDLILRLTALFHDIGKPATLSVDEEGRRHFYKHENVGTDMTDQIMARLKFSNDERRTVSSLVKHHMRPLECGPAGVRRVMRDLGEHFDKWMIFKKADALGAKIDEPEFDSRMQRFMEMVNTERNRKVGSVYSELAVNGNDLVEIGIKPGPAMGNILKQLWEIVLDTPESNAREILLKKAKELYLGSSNSES